MKERPEGDLDYFRFSYLKHHHVEFEDRGDFLIASIIDPSVDEGHAWKSLRREATSCRGTRHIYRHISVRRYLPWIDLEDRMDLLNRAEQQEMYMTVNKLRWFSRRVSAQGSLYIIWNAKAKQCLYIGKTTGDLATRAASHFHRDNRTTCDFDIYCQRNLTECASWVVCLVDSDWCDRIVRKSFFWRSEEYDIAMPNFEDEYQYRKNLKNGWFLQKAEDALIALYQPAYNVIGNIKKSRM